MVKNYIIMHLNEFASLGIERDFAMAVAAREIVGGEGFYWN